jgi:hypothetical protein
MVKITSSTSKLKEPAEKQPLEFIVLEPRTQISPKSEMEVIKQDVERKSAVDCFEMYIEMITVLKQLNPVLFKTAINIVKTTKFPNL